MCFVKGQWDQGLPMLAKGSSQILVELAEGGSPPAPCGPKQQVALADAWWNLGEKESSANKTAIEGRARHWYQQAVDKTSGLDKAREFRNAWQSRRQSHPLPQAPKWLLTSPNFPSMARPLLNRQTVEDHYR